MYKLLLPYWRTANIGLGCLRRKSQKWGSDATLTLYRQFKPTLSKVSGPGQKPAANSQLANYRNSRSRRKNASGSDVVLEVDQGYCFAKAATCRPLSVHQSLAPTHIEHQKDSGNHRVTRCFRHLRSSFDTIWQNHRDSPMTASGVSG